MANIDLKRKAFKVLNEAKKFKTTKFKIDKFNLRLKVMKTSVNKTF